MVPGERGARLGLGLGGALQIGRRPRAGLASLGLRNRDQLKRLLKKLDIS